MIGIPGDSLELKDKILHLNGKATEEPYKIHVSSAGGFTQGDNYGPVTVPADQFFVMGDNRFGARDSRYFGPIHFISIIGKKL